MLNLKHQLIFIRKIHQIVPYKKLKLNDKELTKLILTIRSKKNQTDEKIIIEGNVLITEAVQANIKLNKLIFSDFNKTKDIVKIAGNNFELLKVPFADLSFVSILQTSPGLIGIFDKPKFVKPKANSLPIDVIVDNCREPNNCGSIIRVANSLPVQRILLPKGNVNVWDTKCIRASSGSIFHLQTISQLTWKQIDEMTDNNNIILIADNNFKRYSTKRRLIYDEIPFELIQDKKLSLIIGGEKNGISDEALAFANRREWRAINIPMDKTVESLNISNASAIILFELRRKLKSMREKISIKEMNVDF